MTPAQLAVCTLQRIPSASLDTIAPDGEPSCSPVLAIESSASVTTPAPSEVVPRPNLDADLFDLRRFQRIDIATREG
jgi:hypothetical protein